MNNNGNYIKLLFIIAMGLLISLISCDLFRIVEASGGGSGSVSGSASALDIPNDRWVWTNGNELTNRNGTYGTKGVASASNMPGSRSAHTYAKDSSGNLWIFGGGGFGASGIKGSLNDLWKYNGTNWIWVSGSDLIDQQGVYESAPSSDFPGGREDASMVIDSYGNIWLFGGVGFGSPGF